MPSPQEEIILEMHSQYKYSAFELARLFDMNPVEIRDIINKYPQPKDPEMAKQDKNKAEREKTMAKLRDGTPVYGIEMDKMRGLYSELAEAEAFIITKQAHAKDKLNLRLGDVAYTS